jgi:amino acid adenylation domain-containing protein
VLARVREVFGVELPVRRAFEAPVLAAQAAAIEAAALEATAAEAVADEAPLRPRPRRPGAPAADAPLSFAQRRLWFLDRLAPGSTAYTLSAAVDLDGPLRPGALAAGLAAVVRRHEALRTRFPAPRGVPVQRVAPPPAPRPLPFVDLAALPPAPARRAADRLAAAAARRRFDLARGPLLGAVLLRRAEERWRLLVSVHHAVADGGSLGVVAAELGQLYSAAVEGRPPRLPRLQVQYADWAAWQRRRLDGEALEGPLAWWRQRLDGLPPALGLPTDRPYGPGADLRGGRIERRLPPPLAAALDGLGRGAGATRYMLLLAALAVVLSRWSGQRDLAVGSPESGRARRETENLVGLFLNLLVLRLDLAGEPSFAELLGRVRETVLDAFAHREVPFERLLETLAPERDPARPPLVEVLLNVFAPPRRAPRFAGLDARLVPPVEREARFPLTLYAGAGGGEDAGPDAGEGGGGPLLALVYRRALFDRVRAEELLDQVVLVLEAAAADPARPVAALPALTARARAVLADPAAPLPGPSPQPVARRFAAVAAAHAARPAVVQGGRAWTYGELAAAVERLAAALRRAGVGTGEAVAVGGGPSFSLVAAALAVLRAGGVLLLLDPALPSARRRAAAAAAGARLLVAPPGAAALGLAHLRLTEEAVPHAGLPVLEGPPPRRHPPEAAYVVFTSGSSGEPKGVVGAQLGLAHFLDWQRRTFGIGPGDRVAQLTALSFDVVLRDLLLPLTSGAALVLPEDAALRLDPERVCGWLDAHGVTVLHAVPALARPWLEARPRPPLAALRWVFFAGEPLPAALVDAWRRAFPSSPASETGGNGGIVNLYGPTETTLARCAWRVPEPPAPGVQPVGRALPDSQALVLRAGRRCGLGEVGEIVLRTPCRSLGYLDPTSAGARRFAPSPFREDPGDLLYATGDLGRFRPDGVLEILGREDRQVKLRGVRVEPAEVEAALTAHPAVGAAAVALRGPQLVAWVVPAAGEAVEPRFLRAHLARRLPAALVPSRFVVLERLPTGPTGKLDRGALPAPPAAGEESPVAPRDEVEAALAEIFGEVLGAERVGVRDGFFALGGHSLLAVPLLSRIERRFGRRLPLAALFERPTVEELAELLRAPRRRRRDASPLVTLQPGDGRPPLVLVHPGGGGVLCYAELARALGPEQPVLALQSVGLDGCEAPLDSVEAMAGRYLAALAEVQPAGPYRLGGWSFGGRVAFEMAGRLRGAGEAVALVALLDITPHPSPGPARPAGGGNGAADDGAAPPPDDDPELLARALADAFPLAADDLRGLGDREQLDALLEAARAAGRLPAGVEPRRAEALFRVFKANMAAARAFRPRPYPGPVVLVRAAGSDRFAFPPGDPHDPDPSGGWAALADSVELAVVPGDHHTMVRPPHVEALAAALRRALES